MKLVIVESPTKSKTIQKFLGKNYLVTSSYGHVRDLPKSELGVDVENNFKPRYVIPTKVRKKVNELKANSKKASEIILATDEDREGEAIAFHLAHILKLSNPQRIVFHEITKSAIENALKNPRRINQDLVDAQQARRVLDRLVGYKLSPFLWKKILRGLSAGRVQSVTMKLICEREKKIENFETEEYWSITALLQETQKSKTQFEAILMKQDGEAIPKMGIKTKAQSEKILQDLQEAKYKIIKIDKKETKRNPFPPFRTSTLQQTAAARLRFSAKQTMTLAQRLYETGLITYHRTDSLNLSMSSKASAKKLITKSFGVKYSRPSAYKTKAKSAQEAHEAIRPSYPEKTPDTVKLESGQHKLYKLIWQRFMASQMAPAVFDSAQIDISAKQYIFRSTGQTLKFDGFLKVYTTKFTENELPVLTENETVDLIKLNPEQHFTQPPARYSEASLIKVLEQEGIGRPSTYAPTLETIQRRNYVIKNENRRFEPTKIGKMVNDVLVEHFPKIVDIKFTAKMENDLDEIAEGKQGWTKSIAEFYEPFAKNLKEKEKTVEKKDLTEKTDQKCPECGEPILIRMGRFGKFMACSGFPKCKYTAPIAKPTLGIKCPECNQGEITEKRTKKGRIFYGCNKWPKCEFALWGKPTGDLCPKCNSLLIEADKKGTHIKCSDKTCNYAGDDTKVKTGG